jgi:hypothetical protein
MHALLGKRHWSVRRPFESTVWQGTAPHHEADHRPRTTVHTRPTSPMHVLMSAAMVLHCKPFLSLYAFVSTLVNGALEFSYPRHFIRALTSLPWHRIASIGICWSMCLLVLYILLYFWVAFGIRCTVVAFVSCFLLSRGSSNGQ